MFFAALDLGQIRDPSALVIVERIDHRRAFMGTSFERLLVRYVERMPLGMSYPKIVERVKEILGSEELCGNCVLVVDATGVGAPVVDMLRAARLGCEIVAVVITGGERGNGNGSVPKRDLMAGLQALLDEGKLKIARMRETGRLVGELVDMKRSVSGSGRVRIGADGYGEHDDLAIALALACWRAQGRRQNGEGTGRLF
jgi:threonine dehydrogenase-like Zn-dependent dehydrogenase